MSGGTLLIDDKLDRLRGPPQSPPPPPPLDQMPHLAPMRHYIPVVSPPSVIPSCSDGDVLPSLRRRPAALCVDLNALPDLCAEESSLLVDAEPFTQWPPPPPLTAAPFPGIGVSPSPKSLSALSAFGRFLPSNLERDGADAWQYDMYSGDQFRMYEFKVRKCMRGRSHDWTECPFAHPGEKARRRDPRLYNYVGVLCADYKKGSCKKGDACDLAHGVFECWLHPTRYRTQPCKDGRGCRRRICFFAHTADQLRDGSPASPSLSSLSSSSPVTAFSCPTPVEMLSEAPDAPGSLSQNASRKFVSNPPSESLLIASSLSGGTDALIAPSLSSRSLPFEHSVSLSPLSSSHERHIDYSSVGGPLNFRLPAPMLGEFRHPLQLNPSQVAKANRVPLELQNSFPSHAGVSTMAPSPLSVSGAVQTSQRTEDIVRLMKRMDLAQDQEAAWKDKVPKMLRQQEFLLGQHCARSVIATPFEKSKGNDHLIFGHSFFDADEGLHFERVESGKGLRAQIFENLLNSAASSGI